MLDYAELFKNWEIAIVKKLVGEYRSQWTCLEQEEFEDLMHECLVAWWKARDTYDAARGASIRTYMGVVVRNRLMDLVRAGTADKREINCLAESLEQPLKDDDDSRTLGEEIDESGVGARQVSADRQIGLVVDLERTVAKLTQMQRRLCDLRREGFSMADASRILGTPRSTLSDEITRIRRVFEQAGLKNYLR